VAVVRILFVSGESVGGSAKSTTELAAHLSQRGHQVVVLLGERPGPNAPSSLAARAHSKVSRWGLAERISRPLVRQTGRGATRSRTAGGVEVFKAHQPENAYLRLLESHPPDVVVANSLPRMAMAWISEDLRELGIPLVVYLREQHSLSHLTVTRLNPDAIVANSLELCMGAAAAGMTAEFIPSVVDLQRAATETTRQTAVLVNPVAAHRPDLVIDMAAALPHVPFALQESWPLPAATKAMIMSALERCPNLSFRSQTTEPAEVYRDARVLIAPYPSGRARVVLEAHHNGIPVIGLDQPSMREAVGPAGVLVADTAPPQEWISVVARMWDDQVWYDSLVDESRKWAMRSGVQPNDIVKRFELVLSRVTGRRADG
jgi:hypothetical protein